MIEKTNILAAAANFTNTGGGALTTQFENGCHIVRTGAGTFTATLDQALAATAIVPVVQAQVAGATAISTTVVQTSNTVLTITTAATLGGAAADIAANVGLLVFGIGAPGSSGI